MKRRTSIPRPKDTFPNQVRDRLFKEGICLQKQITSISSLKINIANHKSKGHN